MSDENAHESEPSLDDGGKKRLSGKKLALFVVLPLVLLIGGGAGLYFTGMLDKFTGKKEKEAAEKAEHSETVSKEGPGYYYDLADIIVNLNDANNKQRFLKLSISIEIPKKEDEPKLLAVMPRITDQFQTYLRELRVDDLRGSAGIYRLRQELLARVKAAANPVDVRDVLFREILVQ